MTEHDICVTLCQYLQLKHPKVWAVTFHVPNEGKHTTYYRAKQATIGVKSGVPDYMIAIAKGAYHGMFLEMKTKKGQISVNQNKWIEKLSQQGYLATIARGIDDAIEQVEMYLNL